MGLHRDHRPGAAGADRGAGPPARRRVRGGPARRAGPRVRPAEDRVDPRHAGQHRGQLRPHPRRPAHARPARPAADRRVLQRARGGQPLAGGPGRGPRRRLGELLRRARARRRARAARAPGGDRLPLRGLRHRVRGRARTSDVRLGPSPAGVLGGARRGVRPPRNARGGTSGPARRPDRGDHPARRRCDGRRSRTAGPDDQTARLARCPRRGVRAAGGAGGQLPAAAARAGLRRGIRRRPRRARAGGQPVAAGGDRPDGRQLPGRRGGGQRVRGPGRRRGHGGRRGSGRRPRTGPRAAAPQDRARHRGLHRRTRDDPRPGHRRPGRSAPRSPATWSRRATGAWSPATWASPTPPRPPR